MGKAWLGLGALPSCQCVDSKVHCQLVLCVAAVFLPNPFSKLREVAVRTWSCSQLLGNLSGLFTLHVVAA